MPRPKLANSYISYFKMKRLLLSLLISFVLLIGVAVTLVHIDQEARYFSEAAAISERWEQSLREEGSGSLIIFSGGSEVRTCINPESFQKSHGLRVVNAGQHAGFGLVCNIISAIPRLQPGDTFVVSVVHTNGDCEDLPLMGLRYLWRRVGVKAFSSQLFPHTVANILKSMRFNQQTDWSYLRALRHHRLSHGYDEAALLHQPSGWMEILRPQDVTAFQYQEYRTKQSTEYASTVQFLVNLKEYCDARSIKLVCFFPWRYHERNEDISKRRQDNIRFALLLAQNNIPILKDENLGYVSDASLFSDTILHQNRKGAELYADVLGRLLISHSSWEREELRALLENNK